MQIGKWKLQTVSGGMFLIDGGTMFGVVPKPLWQRAIAPDEMNRIPSATNCVLARDGEHCVLIDTGYGGKIPEREAKYLESEPAVPIVTHLSELGVTPEEITMVIFSHLHFDHAGGSTSLDAEGELHPTFSKARHVVQQRELDDALSEALELQGAYPLENVQPLVSAGAIDTVDGEAEILPGIHVVPTGGHTAGHQAIFFRDNDHTAVYIGDICPMQAHLRTNWCMSYDSYLLDTRRTKERMLQQAADEQWWLLFDHDPQIAAAQVTRSAQGKVELGERLERLE